MFRRAFSQILGLGAAKKAVALSCMVHLSPYWPEGSYHISVTAPDRPLFTSREASGEDQCLPSDAGIEHSVLRMSRKTILFARTGKRAAWHKVV